MERYHHAKGDKPTPLPTLRSLALRLCIINANNFVSLGDLPFILVQPILQACSATQLAHLEDQSPHLRPDTQEIWHRLVSERFKREFEKQDDEDWRDVYERLKLDESERLKSATARLRAKNGKIQEEKMAKQIVVIDPKKMSVSGDHRKRSNPFAGNSAAVSKLTRVHGSPQRKKNSLIEKARKETSFTKMNYAAAPRYSVTRPTGSTRPAMSPTKVRREPAPPNDNNIFGKPAEIPKVCSQKPSS